MPSSLAFRARKPNLSLYAGQDPTIVRWYQEDQVLDIIRSDPMNLNRVSEIDSRPTASWQTCSTEASASPAW